MPLIVTRIIVHVVHDNKLFAAIGAVLLFTGVILESLITAVVDDGNDIVACAQPERACGRPCSVILILLEIAAQPETLDPGLAVALDDSTGSDCATGRECGG